MTNKDWLEEFKEFLAVDSVSPPNQLSQNILARVERELQPAFFHLLIKIGLIQLIVGAVTLLFCPQFEFGLLHGSGLAGFLFRHFGFIGCQLGCGMTFMGSGIFVSSFVLSAEEIRAFRAHRASLISLLVLFALGTFICIGGTRLIEWITIFWALGAFIGGLASLQVGLRFRHQFDGYK